MSATQRNVLSEFKSSGSQFAEASSEFAGPVSETGREREQAFAVSAGLDTEFALKQTVFGGRERVGVHERMVRGAAGRAEPERHLAAANRTIGTAQSAREHAWMSAPVLA